MNKQISYKELPSTYKFYFKQNDAVTVSFVRFIYYFE